MKKVFVVGCPRSGTTLVQSYLGARSDTFTLKETHFFPNIRRVGKRKIFDYLFLSQSRVLRAFGLIAAHNKLLHQYDPHTVTTFRSAVRFFDQMMSGEAQTRGKEVWLEKTPSHMFYIPLIKRHLPSVQFVHVLRDGRDVVASMVDTARRYPEAKAWKEHVDIATATDKYNRYMMESHKYYGSQGHTFIQYEQILDDPERSINRLFFHLGLENQKVQPALKGINKKIARSDEGWKADPKDEIKDTRLVKFNQIFNEEQRRFIIERIRKVPFVQPPL